MAAKDMERFKNEKSLIIETKQSEHARNII
jgi:hypothetical protein